MNIKRTQLRLPEILHEQLTAESHKQGVSMNSLIVEIINTHMTEKAPTPTKVEEALTIIANALQGHKHVKYSRREEKQ